MHSLVQSQTFKCKIIQLTYSHNKSQSNYSANLTAGTNLSSSCMVFHLKGKNIVFGKELMLTKFMKDYIEQQFTLSFYELGSYGKKLKIGEILLSYQEFKNNMKITKQLKSEFAAEAVAEVQVELLVNKQLKKSSSCSTFHRQSLNNSNVDIAISQNDQILEDTQKINKNQMSLNNSVPNALCQKYINQYSHTFQNHFTQNNNSILKKSTLRKDLFNPKQNKIKKLPQQSEQKSNLFETKVCPQSLLSPCEQNKIKLFRLSYAQAYNSIVSYPISENLTQSFHKNQKQQLYDHIFQIKQHLCLRLSTQRQKKKLLKQNNQFLMKSNEVILENQKTLILKNQMQAKQFEKQRQDLTIQIRQLQKKYLSLQKQKESQEQQKLKVKSQLSRIEKNILSIMKQNEDYKNQLETYKKGIRQFRRQMQQKQSQQSPNEPSQLYEKLKNRPNINANNIKSLMGIFYKLGNVSQEQIQTVLQIERKQSRQSKRFSINLQEKQKSNFADKFLNNQNKQPFNILNIDSSSNYLKKYKSSSPE